MFKLDQNFYDRKCYFARQQVPTQTVMKKKMGTPLATVYFKSMNSKLKILAGLEPPLRGGGSDWYIPPYELLKGRVVMKPIKKKYLSQLSYQGIGAFGEKLIENHHQEMENEQYEELYQNDLNWKKTIESACRQQWHKTSKEEAQHNTNLIKDAFNEFQTLYANSITKIEGIVMDSAIQEIKRIREAAYIQMVEKYHYLLKQQSKMLYDRYTDKLNKEKDRLKNQFIENIESSRTIFGRKAHDINVDKHVAIEKLRHLLECQNLACQIYVALKEREEGKREIDKIRHKHKKSVKFLSEQIAWKNYEIEIEKEKAQCRQKFIEIWQKKVCHVVKKFQTFVSYCLKTLPEHADFFLNMEKLMLLQLNDAVENPEAESIIVSDIEQFHTPVARPKPFVLFGDMGDKPQVEKNLCPKVISSNMSQLPVIVINRRCVYAACDNFELFTDQIKEYIQGRGGDDILDDHDYEYDNPVEYSSSQQLLDLKLEGSLMRVLQNEMVNTKDVPTECCLCKLPYCFCSPLLATKMHVSPGVEEKVPLVASIPSSMKIMKRSEELKHEREPKWKSYIEYVKPKKCKCAKTAKKHLNEHIPPYMKNMSYFAAPEIPHYERCSLDTLKALVKATKGSKPAPSPPAVVPSKTKEISTQYSDPEFDELCTCFSEKELEKLCKQIFSAAKPFSRDKLDRNSEAMGVKDTSYLDKKISSFTTDRARSLLQLINKEPELKEIFNKHDCNF